MKMYNAVVEVDRKDAADIDALMDQLEHHHPAVGLSPRGWLEARISLPAENLTQACTTATLIVEAATGAAAIATEVMTEEEFAAREGFEPVPDLLGVTEAAEILGVTRQRIDQLVHAGKLQAIPIGVRARGYTRVSVEALAAQERTSGRPARGAR